MWCPGWVHLPDRLCNDYTKGLRSLSRHSATHAVDWKFRSLKFPHTGSRGSPQPPWAAAEPGGESLHKCALDRENAGARKEKWGASVSAAWLVCAFIPRNCSEQTGNRRAQAALEREAQGKGIQLRSFCSCSEPLGYVQHVAAGGRRKPHLLI